MLKRVVHSVAGSPVRGGAWNSHHFKNQRVCWLHGLNKLEAAMQQSVVHSWEKRLCTLPQGWALKILKLLMAGLTVSSSYTVLCTKLYQDSAKVWLFKSGGNGERQLLIITGGYEPMNINNVDETRVVFRLPLNKTRSLTRDPCSDG
jgi:hypothetical protein